MNLPDINKTPKFEYLILLPIIALAFYIAFIPHHNYPYPVHVDEWVHLARSKAMLAAGSTTFIDPFLGQSTVSISTGQEGLEAGFHLFWGVFQSISGISWLTIFRYFPSIVFIITVLSVYTLARRQGFGWEAALFTCLIPTTVGILGPAFLVPVTMGLLFIPLCLFLAFNFKNVWSYLIVLIFTSFLLLIHAPSAIGLAIVLVPYILLNLKGNFKHSLGLTLAIAIPFVVPFPWIFNMLLPTVKALFVPQPLPEYVVLPQIISTYGYVPILLCLLGTFVLAMRGRREDYGLTLGLLAMLLMLVTFFTFHYGLHIMYERGLMYMMLIASIVAGAGLMRVKNLKPPALGYILCLVLIGLSLAMCIPARQSTDYYQMIDKQDYEAFIWIKDNVSDNYEKAILDPWKATAFTAISEKNIYTRIHKTPEPSDKQASQFLRDGCTDTSFLRGNGISIVYTRAPCQNPDLVEVRKNIYLLKEAQNNK